MATKLVVVVFFFFLCGGSRMMSYCKQEKGGEERRPQQANISNKNNSSRPFPAYFIFGDSLVDVGNNNYITTIAKANNLPFGIDFPAGPTGRFTNGKIVPDFLCELLGLPFPPPYLSPTTRGKVLLNGVSYASAASGILRSTGYNFIGRVDFDTQLTWFANNIQELGQLIGPSATQELLSRSLFSIIIGANDYINNYLLKSSPLAFQYSPQEFQQVLLDKLSSQLIGMYNMGARKMTVSSVGPIGCIPSQLAKARSVNGECSEAVNSLALSFNQGLVALIQKLSPKLPHAKFVYADSYAPVLAFRTNPSQHGFKFGAEACCGAGLYKGQVLCLPIITPCLDRRDYVFFDPFHPTESSNRLLADNLFQSLSALY